MMLLLSCIWLVMGALPGLLARGAKLGPQVWGKRGWLVIPGTGMLSALLGGWLGAWLSGVQYGTVTALWVGTLGACLLPWLFRGIAANAGRTHPPGVL